MGNRQPQRNGVSSGAGPLNGQHAMIPRIGWSLLVLLACVPAPAILAQEPPSAADPMRFSFQDSSGVGRQPGICRRDPSDVIRVGDTWYVWYTRVAAGAPLYPSGYSGTIWYATSTNAGRTWAERALAVGKGAAPAFDAHAVFTPNILVKDGRYYLYYTAVATGFRNTGCEPLFHKYKL